LDWYLEAPELLFKVVAQSVTKRTQKLHCHPVPLAKLIKRKIKIIQSDMRHKITIKTE